MGRYVKLYIATPMHRSQLGVVTSKETRQSRTNTDRAVARHSHSFSN